MPTILSAQMKDLEAPVIAVLQTVFDPEIPVNIYELGLIYSVDIDADGNIKLAMTLTSPMCPVAGSLPGEVEQKVKTVPGVQNVTVDLVWEPAWTKDMMTDAAKLQLNLF